jgi:beta-lactamase class A
MISAQNKLSELNSSIQNRLDSVTGTFAVAFIDLNNANNQIIINGSEVFHAASTMKTPVMIEVLKQSMEGKFSIDDSIIIKNEFTSIADGSKFSLAIEDDSGKELFQCIGKKRSIRNLINDMITFSSNLATNVLIELVKAENIMKTLNFYGVQGINVLRGVEDIKAFEQGMNNTVTAIGLMKLFEKLATGEFISAYANKIMLEILQEQKHNRIIPFLLPNDVKVAHKTGSITGVCHDTGIIFLPGEKKYVLILLSKNLQDSEEGSQVLAEISKLIYDFIISQ